MSMTPLAHRDDDWSTSPFTPHMPFSDEIRSPTASYPSQYASHQIPQQPSYPYPVIPTDTRNMHFPASYNQHSTHMGPQSSAERVVVSRGREVHPYARSTATPQSVSYGAEPVAPAEEPVIKKKRKRADAAQLKVLNETYQRTAFPSTEERQALATQLDMPPRSVQIWYVGILKASLPDVDIPIC
jgi:homeobox protein YOX1/YHP1